MIRHFKTISLWVFVAAAAVVFAVAGCNKKEKYLRISPPSFNFDAGPQDVTATVEASASWMQFSNIEWLDSYVDDDDPTIIHIVIAETNNSLSPREAEIDIATGDAQKTTIRIYQQAIEASLDVTPPGLKEFDGRGTKTHTLTVDAVNLLEGWDVVRKPEWIVVEDGGEGNEHILTVKAKYTDLIETRKDTIVIGPLDTQFIGLNDTIPVEQAGLGLILWRDKWGETMLEVGPEAADVDFTIVSLYDWTASVDNEATLSEVSGEATNQGDDFTVTIPENKGTETVTYTVTFECDGETYSYTIVQAAPEPEEPEGPEENGNH